ncbi:8560_t:CDS:2 [Paraglomus brasilianum]|uniref:8560_t:CDS:1 n=1 Tax=Paraglomus brasilianum TaxID=144538 RepID=A0A9N9CQK4_9GLOM|nr:8560_t:CDS:2 [Paraglomus brasilianum]
MLPPPADEDATSADEDVATTIMYARTVSGPVKEYLIYTIRFTFFEFMLDYTLGVTSFYSNRFGEMKEDPVSMTYIYA